MAQLSTPSTRGRKRHGLHIDMTPLVDLAFLLLTFFVLTRTLNKDYTLEVNKPEDKNGAVVDVSAERVLTLMLGAENKIYYERAREPMQTTDYSHQGIRKLLLDSKRDISRLVVIIKPMKESRYQNLVDILDEVSITKLSNYYLVKATHEDRERIARFNGVLSP